MNIETTFCGVELKVLHGVFRPRAETENIINKLKENFTAICANTALDLCAGTGAMGIALTHLYELESIEFVDIASTAIENMYLNSDKIRAPYAIIHCDAKVFVEHCDSRFNLIVSNPPCLSDELKNVVDMAALENADAYFSGPTGRELLVVLKRAFDTLLAPGGVMAFQCLLDEGIKDWIRDHWFGYTRLIYVENGVLIQKAYT